jgi:hypothetical protein
MSHDDSDIEEEEVVSVPPEPFDLLANLVCPSDIVIGDGP